MKHKRYQAYISGRVQGVCCLANTRRQRVRLGSPGGLEPLGRSRRDGLRGGAERGGGDARPVPDRDAASPSGSSHCCGGEPRRRVLQAPGKADG